MPAACPALCWALRSGGPDSWDAFLLQGTDSKLENTRGDELVTAVKPDDVTGRTQGARLVWDQERFREEATLQLKRDAVRSCLGWGPRAEEWRLRSSRDKAPEGVRAQVSVPWRPVTGDGVGTGLSCSIGENSGFYSEFHGKALRQAGKDA